MNINHMQRTLATKYQADASRMKKRLQHADSDTAAKRQSGDRVDISGEGLTALRGKNVCGKGNQPACEYRKTLAPKRRSTWHGK